MTCECPADGFCARYKREMTGRVREICQGINIDPAKAEAYRRNWLALANAPAGSGEHLRRLLHELDITSREGCGCKERISQMDGWGRACAGHRAEIASWLQEAAAERGWLEKIRTGVKLLAQPWFNPVYPYGSIVDEAIRRSEESLRGATGGTLIKRFDETNLAPGQPGKRFNSSIIAYGDGYLMAYRDGWAGSEIHLVRLDAACNPVGNSWKLHLRHSKANYGREDPRLFMHNGRVHVAYAGVVGRPLHTNVLYARLAEDLTVEQVSFPMLKGRNRWEKNWSFFSSGGELFAVYAVAPHRIIRVDGSHAEFVYESPTRITWHGGEMRGGASPVLVGDEWWHFFHDRIDTGGMATYRTGLYTFSAKPPFAPLRYLPDPLMVANAASRPHDQYCNVVFTCGAAQAGNGWILSSGIHDRWTELQRFDNLEQKLIRCEPIALPATDTESLSPNSTSIPVALA